MNKKIFFTLVLLAMSTNSLQALTFDPNNILSDAEYTDSTAMSKIDIQTFLTSKGGYISNYSTTAAEGEKRTAAEIIYNAANNFDCDGVDENDGRYLTRAEKEKKCRPVKINPKVLLVLLQKEQSLIEAKSPTARQLDWAVGYGCFDGQACNDRWKGFGKQVNSAALQFIDYFENPNRYTYKKDNTYIITNTGKEKSVVTPVNKATAALYNYTPHVYNGNYNFFALWNKFFSRLYTNNTLMHVTGEKEVWLIQNGKRRVFSSRGALLSRFDPKKIIEVSKSTLETYPIGAPIKFSQYSLVRSPKGNIYLIVDDMKRGIVSKNVFKNIGFNMEEVVKATWEDLNTYKDGPVINENSAYPTGALLQDKKTGGVFWATDGTIAPVQDRIFLKTMFKGKRITPVDAKKLLSYKKVAPVKFADGELLKGTLSTYVYVIDQGKKRPIADEETFYNLGYNMANIITVSDNILNQYETGEILTEVFREELIERKDDFVVSSSSPATPTIDNITASSTPATSTTVSLPTSTSTAATSTR